MPYSRLFLTPCPQGAGETTELSDHTGKRLVVTAFGSANPTVASVQLQIDGIPEVTTHTETPTTMREVPRWLVVNAGSTVAVLFGDGAPDDCRAWGYLVDA